MAPAAPASPSPSPASSKAVPIVLSVLLGMVLLVIVGVYTVFHVVAGKVRALTAGDVPITERSLGSSSGGASLPQGAQVTGNVIGNLLGTDAKGRTDIGKALGNMAQTGRQIEQHDKAVGNANGTPDAQDTQQAMNAAGNLFGALAESLGGAQRHDPVDFHALEALLPSSLPGLQRGTPRGEVNSAIGIKATSADVDFNGPSDARINVSIKDATAISGLAGLAEMANSQESEQGDNYEKNKTLASHRVHEKWDAQARHGELSLLVGKRFGIDISGSNVDMAALESALARIDLVQLESMKNANSEAQ